MPAGAAGASWTTSCIAKAKLFAMHEAFKFLVDDDTFHSASALGASKPAVVSVSVTDELQTSETTRMVLDISRHNRVFVSRVETNWVR